jgi:hypothetical protein
MTDGTGGGGGRVALGDLLSVDVEARRLMVGRNLDSERSLIKQSRHGVSFLNPFADCSRTTTYYATKPIQIPVFNSLSKVLLPPWKRL